ncbi:hypothetical protein [Staphylococcus simulans]|uniref:hypothetical protein n=1 Tax=Staphylococcus simulans TaxID=1286 RepID=UPI000D1D40C3|nr:hypothetical protein [Staphylococcus simulans]PTJ29928.1 hypothetical protein BU025_07850 [Staphylococcus simulans]
METKEFIASMQNLGFKVDGGTVEMSIFDKDNDNIAQVSREVQWSMWTCSFAFSEMLEEDKEDLFNVMVEYTSTPIEERDKYYIKHKYLRKHTAYLNYDKSLQEWTFHTKSNAVNLKTQFTIAELPGWVHEMLEDGYLVKEEVE